MSISGRLHVHLQRCRLICVGAGLPYVCALPYMCNDAALYACLALYVRACLICAGLPYMCALPYMRHMCNDAAPMYASSVYYTYTYASLMCTPHMRVRMRVSYQRRHSRTLALRESPRVHCPTLPLCSHPFARTCTSAGGWCRAAQWPPSLTAVVPTPRAHELCVCVSEEHILE